MTDSWRMTTVLLLSLSAALVLSPVAAQTCAADSFLCIHSPNTSTLALGSDVGHSPPSSPVPLAKVEVSEYSEGYLILAFDDGARECASEGLFMPLFPSEPLWSPVFRAILYFLGMVWCFLGIALVADRFMAAIEVITSKEKVITYTDHEGVSQEVVVLVWNETVANLTLMALGSSAPEILLACVETVGDLGGPIPKEGDGLGAATIVGSAAFNLLVIIGICILAIESPEVRRIKEIGVFCVTAFFSVFAYLWMLFVLKYSSEDRVELWEALITLALFPILVAASYAQDQGMFACKCCRKQKALTRRKSSKTNLIHPSDGVGGGGAGAGGEDGAGGGSSLGRPGSASRGGPRSAADVARVLKEEVPEAMQQTEVDLAAFATRRFMERRHYSIARYVVNASRGLTGGHRVLPKAAPPRRISLARRGHPSLEEVKVEDESKAGPCQGGAGAGAGAGAGVTTGAGRSPQPVSRSVHEQGTDMTIPTVSFASPTYDVFENEGHVELKVIRTGDLDSRVDVLYYTSNGTAMAGEDYIATSGTLTFNKGDTEALISVEIVDDNEYEPDETFLVALHLPPADVSGSKMGLFPIATVTIIDDDTPGEFEFENAHYTVSEDCGSVEITVVRKNGSDGTVKLHVFTEDSPSGAKADQDYMPVETDIVFEHSETRKTFSIPIIDDQQYEKDESFIVGFEIDRYPDCGAKYGPNGQALVTITNNVEFSKLTDKVAEIINMNLSKFKVSTESWAEQFKEAMTVYGEDEDSPPTGGDYFMHILTFFWKILFAFIPPTSFSGGWLTFWISLAFIGLVTAVVGDLASLFGCAVGLTEALTAITFVALGTSLPDTFASKTAAVQDDHADASVGNVTGSNSVNVFLGLGLPWTIACIYHEFDDSPYIVPAGSLGFSVTVFCCIAVVAIALILVRRHPKVAGGALGGPKGVKYVSAGILFGLWGLYVTLSALKSEGQLD